MDDFFGIGMGEILLVLVVAVILLGPARMIELGRTLGRFMGNLRKMSYDITSQVSREIDVEKKPAPPRQENDVSRIDGKV